MDKTLVVMAAGMGSRYGGLKQMDKLGPCGEIIMDYSIYDAVEAGFNKVVFIIKEENFQLFKEVIGDRIEKALKVDYVFQSINRLPKGYTAPKGREKPWGTGHAVLCCKDVVREPFVVINADDFYGKDAFSIISKWIESNKSASEYSMAGYILKNTLTENGFVSRGVCTLSEDGKLKNVTERTKITRKGDFTVFEENGKETVIDENSIVSMNFWCFKPSFFEHGERIFKAFLDEKGNCLKSEFYLPFAVQDMIDDGICTVEVLNTHGEWFGVTYKEDREPVAHAIQKKAENGEYPAPLWR